MKQLLLLLFLSLPIIGWTQPNYELVLQGGRVIDPETNLDTLANVGISGGKIAAISTQTLSGEKVINVSGKVVVPGFIDLHTHSPTPLGQYYQAYDGVTTALELEAGAFPVAEYGEQIAEQPLLNFGSSVGYMAIRLRVKQGVVLPHVMTSSPSITGWRGMKSMLQTWLGEQPTAVFSETASSAERAAMRTLLHQGIDEGGLGIGLALDYISEAVDEAELGMIFDVAAERSVPVFIHVRRGVAGDPSGLREALTQARRAKAAVHICHVTHSAMGNIALFLAEIDAAKADGVDVTVEILPYNAGSALISSAVFSRDWQEIFDITYSDVEWAATGERFTQESWETRRKDSPEGQVIHHYLQEPWTRTALAYPDMIVVSDLLPMESRDKKVAPHNGAFTKVLSHYVREAPLLSLDDALRRMTLLPAKRLEQFAPAFKRKGRLQVGMDADITVFDAQRLQSKATYRDPYQEAVGIEFVIVGGEPIIFAGKLVENTAPGERLLAR